MSAYADEIDFLFRSVGHDFPVRFVTFKDHSRDATPEVSLRLLMALRISATSSAPTEEDSEHVKTKRPAPYERAKAIAYCKPSSRSCDWATGHRIRSKFTTLFISVYDLTLKVARFFSGALD